mmetsp:Transcript_12093/g.46948  ORF Transcript_12093/g.46948 Transcript_12093/m.46948 type:complete len:563 (-) Transcript_12093:1149-2837(-)
MENTTGDAPSEWYREEEHIGYDVDGRRISKRRWNDSIENLLHTIDDPSYWRKVFDEKEDREISLSRAHVELIQRLRSGAFPKSSSSSDLKHEQNHGIAEVAWQINHEPKRRFIPSKWEAKLVLRIVRALRAHATPNALQSNTVEQKMIWEAEDATQRSTRDHTYLPAQKPKKPDHVDSYNPPFEYQISDEDAPGTNGHDNHATRTLFNALRRVPSYSEFVVERFQRCLDLYLCPRVKKHRLHVRPQDILPPLPSPKDLKPFPSSNCLKFTGHEDKILSIAIDHSGQWLLSASEDCTIRKWEISSSRCISVWRSRDIVKSVAWCPSPIANTFSACVASDIVLLKSTRASGSVPLLSSHYSVHSKVKNSKLPEWKERDGEMIVHLASDVSKVTWHKKGDYFASFMIGGNNVMIHRMSRRTSQLIFRDQKFPIQSAMFHPYRPFMLICTRTCVYLYDLNEQSLIKKLSSGNQTLSCMAVHPGGDNLIIGTDLGRLAWFDLDLATSPYKVMATHASAVKVRLFFPPEDNSSYVSSGCRFPCQASPVCIGLRRCDDPGISRHGPRRA